MYTGPLLPHSHCISQEDVLQRLALPAAKLASSGEHVCIVALSNEYSALNGAFWGGLDYGFGVANEAPDAQGLLLAAALAMQSDVPADGGLALRAVGCEGSRMSDLLIPSRVANSRAHSHLPAVKLRQSPGGGVYTQGASVQRISSAGELHVALTCAYKTLELGMNHMGTSPRREPHSVHVSLFLLPSPEAPLTAASGRLDIVKLPHVLPASMQESSSSRTRPSLRDHARIVNVLSRQADVPANEAAAADGSARKVHVPYRDTPITRMLQCCVDARTAKTAAAFWLGHVASAHDECASTAAALGHAARLTLPRHPYEGEASALQEASPQAVAAAAADKVARSAASSAAVRTIIESAMMPGTAPKGGGE